MFEQVLAVLTPLWMSYMPTRVVKCVQMGWKLVHSKA
jgi:hypothetical protein